MADDEQNVINVKMDKTPDADHVETKKEKQMTLSYKDGCVESEALAKSEKLVDKPEQENERIQVLDDPNVKKEDNAGLCKHSEENKILEKEKTHWRSRALEEGKKGKELEKQVAVLNESLKSYESDFRREKEENAKIKEENAKIKEENAKIKEMLDKAQQESERTKRENQSHMATIQHLEDEKSEDKKMKDELCRQIIERYIPVVKQEEQRLEFERQAEGTFDHNIQGSP